MSTSSAPKQNFPFGTFWIFQEMNYWNGIFFSPLSECRWLEHKNYLFNRVKSKENGIKEKKFLITLRTFKCNLLEHEIYSQKVTQETKSVIKRFSHTCTPFLMHEISWKFIQAPLAFFCSFPFAIFVFLRPEAMSRWFTRLLVFTLRQAQYIHINRSSN